MFSLINVNNQCFTTKKTIYTELVVPIRSQKTNMLYVLTLNYSHQYVVNMHKTNNNLIDKMYTVVVLPYGCLKENYVQDIIGNLIVMFELNLFIFSFDFYFFTFFKKNSTISQNLSLLHSFCKRSSEVLKCNLLFYYEQ